MTREEGINLVFPGPSHVVILGAGASIASCIHNPEPNGLTLPSMDNFIKVLDLHDIVEAANIDVEHHDFELVYSVLHGLNPNSTYVKDLEERVTTYFERLTLPPTPTIYDYLVLSLRPKDLIATSTGIPFFTKHGVAIGTSAYHPESPFFTAAFLLDTRLKTKRRVL